MDVIPVDMVISTILAASLKVESEPEKIHVFHCTSGTVNPTNWERYVQAIVRSTRQHPCKYAAWYPTVRLRDSLWRNNIVILVCQIIPACIARIIAPNSYPGRM